MLTPVTRPEPASTVALEVLPLAQLPPEGDELNEVVLPIHTDNVPPIVPGLAFTVTIAVTLMPESV